MPLDATQRGRFEDIEKLLDARGLIADPDHWVKGTYKHGNAYCAVGALSAVCGSLSWETPNQVEQRLVRVLSKGLPRTTRFWRIIRLRTPRGCVVVFNDRPQTEHGDVLALFDSAIERLRAEARIGAEV